MQIIADRRESPSAIRSDLGAIFISLLVWRGAPGDRQEAYDEGIAIHIVPESCATAREGEVLTGESVDQPLVRQAKLA